jgi:hypothetical protein
MVSDVNKANDRAQLMLAYEMSYEKNNNSLGD